MSLGVGRALVVLGCALRPDGRPSPALARRLDRAAALFAEGAAPWILVTGGPPGAAPTEAEAMRADLIARGAPAAAVLVEDRARDTLENARFCAPILRRAGVGTAVLVTDRVHMRRARVLFRMRGLQVLPAPCDGPSDPWRRALYAAREAAALPIHAARAAVERA